MLVYVTKICSAIKFIPDMKAQVNHVKQFDDQNRELSKYETIRRMNSTDETVVENQYIHLFIVHLPICVQCPSFTA